MEREEQRKPHLRTLLCGASRRDIKLRRLKGAGSPLVLERAEFTSFRDHLCQVVALTVMFTCIVAGSIGVDGYLMFSGGPAHPVPDSCLCSVALYPLFNGHRHILPLLIQHRPAGDQHNFSYDPLQPEYTQKVSVSGELL